MYHNYDISVTDRPYMFFLFQSSQTLHILICINGLGYRFLFSKCTPTIKLLMIKKQHAWKKKGGKLYKQSHRK